MTIDAHIKTPIADRLQLRHMRLRLRHRAIRPNQHITTEMKYVGRNLLYILSYTKPTLDHQIKHADLTHSLILGVRSVRSKVGKHRLAIDSTKETHLLAWRHVNRITE